MRESNKGTTLEVTFFNVFKFIGDTLVNKIKQV